MLGSWAPGCLLQPGRITIVCRLRWPVSRVPNCILQPGTFTTVPQLAAPVFSVPGCSMQQGQSLWFASFACWFHVFLAAFCSQGHSLQFAGSALRYLGSWLLPAARDIIYGPTARCAGFLFERCFGPYCSTPDSPYFCRWFFGARYEVM